MVSDEDINTIVNETRGQITKEIESYLDIPDDKSISDLFTDATGEDLSRMDVEKILIKSQMQSFEAASEMLDDSEEHLILYFITAICKSIVNKKRMKSIDIACTHRFNQTEAAISQLDTDYLLDLESFIKSDLEQGEYSQMTDSLRDISRNIDKYTDDFGYLDDGDFSEKEIRDLKKILDDCIKYIDSAIHIVNALSTVLREEPIDKKRASEMNLNNKTKSLKGTPIEFIFDTYDTTIRNAIKHGGDEIRYTEEKCYFKSRNDEIELSYKEFATYVSYFIGSVFCIHSIPSITHSETIDRKYQFELYNSKFEAIEEIE